MNREQGLQTICDLFECSCIELFESFNCRIKTLDDAELDTLIVPTARIDSGNSELEIVIALHLPFSALAMTYPVQDNITRIDEAELEDWLTELSNRLLGKFNRHLSLYGCQLNHGLPEYYFGTQDSPAVDKEFESFAYHFDLDHELFKAVISIELFGKEVTLLEQRMESTDMVQDGDLELF